ncbi:MAG: FAD-dependent oxidoreductase, partial [Polyangiales bacterium]
AWSLHRAGYEVELFEKGPALGGNAKTFRWTVGDRVAESPLLVIAWPEKYYHNYHLLLEELGLGRTTLPISYFVKRGEEIYRQDGESSLDVRFAPQFKRWRRLVTFVSAVCNFFLPRGGHESIYHFSYFNPMNVIPLYWLARLFGVSKEFWHTIFVPVHSATFITTSMKGIPAVILPILESIVPLETPCRMGTWDGPPRRVFERMTAPFGAHVHTDHEIKNVARERGRFVLHDQEGRRFEADKVIFACDAHAVLGALDRPTWLQRVLLGNSQYVDDVDPTFSKFVVHSDATIFPEAHREEICSNFNTYVELDDDGSLECTFVLSSKYPGLHEFGVPMLVTFNSKKAIGEVRKRIDLPHPNHTLSLRNLIIMSAMRFLQGKNDIFYCGTFTTPEGGHDLSFMSGLVAARAVGAPYPLPRRSEDAHADYHQMQKMMLGKVLPDQTAQPTTADTQPVEPSASLRG